MFYIYRYTCEINGKIYIGKTNNPARRKIEHLSSSIKGINYFYNAIRKHGYNNFKFEILEQCSTEEMAYKLEEFYINFYNSNNRKNGYNLTTGGEGLQNPSQETLQKMSINAKLRVGNKNPFYGKKHSKETKNKISAANSGNQTQLGKKHTEQTKRKISDKNSGKRFSIATEFKPGQIPTNAKISFEQAQEIRKKYENGEPSKNLQTEYNLSKSSINKIINFKTFKIRK